MKAIMISIQPKWVAKILNGEKTIEIRKTMTKDFEGWVYIYCTLGGNPKNTFLAKTKNMPGFCIDQVGFFCNELKDKSEYNNSYTELNGKVVARFYLKKVRKYTENDTIRSETIKSTCLTSQEIWQYAKGKPVYFWNIDNLEIFDEPKELSEFEVACPTEKCCKCKYAKFMCGQVACRKPKLTNAPQSFMYIDID